MTPNNFRIKVTRCLIRRSRTLNQTSRRLMSVTPRDLTRNVYKRYPSQRPMPCLRCLRRPISMFRQMEFPNAQTRGSMLFKNKLSRRLMRRAILLLRIPIRLSRTIFLYFLLSTNRNTFSWSIFPTRNPRIKNPTYHTRQRPTMNLPRMLTILLGPTSRPIVFHCKRMINYHRLSLSSYRITTFWSSNGPSRDVDSTDTPF